MSKKINFIENNSYICYSLYRVEVIDMDNDIKKKGILIAITIIMIGLLISGGTYALLTQQVVVTNGNYVTNTHCFNVTYQNDNTSITGTLFPSGDVLGGINDYVLATADATCGLNGKGTLKMHIDSGTSDVLTGTVTAHCENEKTLETISEYTTQGACTAVTGNKWVTDGTALKYAVFIGNDLYNSDYIKTSNIGNDIVIHDNFSVTSTTKNIEVYVWLDGYLSGDTYYDLPFNSSIRLETSQTKSTTTYPGDTPLLLGYLSELKLEHLYYRIEYIQSTGTQYINVGLTAKDNTGFYIDFQPTTTTKAWKSIFGARPNGSGRAGDFSIWVKPNTNDVITVARQNESVSMSVEALQRVVITLDAEKQVFCNNVYKGSFTATLSVNPNMLAFTGQNTNHILPSKLYGLIIYEGNTIMRDFIPVRRKTDSKPGLFDKANGIFYTNAATSGNDFTLGPDV